MCYFYSNTVFQGHSLTAGAHGMGISIKVLFFSPLVFWAATLTPPLKSNVVDIRVDRVSGSSIIEK